MFGALVVFTKLRSRCIHSIYGRALTLLALALWVRNHSVGLVRCTEGRTVTGDAVAHSTWAATRVLATFAFDIDHV